ncbi:muramoyltetrapeptide carboxypeptidase [Oceanobacillus limi]|uniref:Muramoyltetrapeptide carboxypeptidase n=1 Tax=Oceanobacillus limi TaxID=930131 RepID=A0A1I0G4A3_9BACI|nr:LD-carboxypeptidase [Oceanobacillus limi]SET65664.1 muramoyltetrapeptide carboxypeptidase [Oceanobacillus limi]
MLYPKALQQGDTIAVIAPAGPVDKERLDKGVSFLKEKGLYVELGKHVKAVHGYLAGRDEERLADFHQMVADPMIKGIIFARGGYGAGRIAADIDYELIRANPKIIWGYSDITYLHTAVRQQTGLVTFHGPMPASDIASEEFDALSAKGFDQLFRETELCYREEISPLQVLNGGVATGPLVGGNLSLIISTLGTRYEIDTRGKLLFIEDIDEVPYRIDGMLNQLKLAGKLEHAAGIVVGDFAKAVPKKEPSLSLQEVFEHYFGKLTCPVMSGFKIGHCYPHIAIPLGAKATLNTYQKTLHVEAGVRR